jgi:hypothetical protein
VPPERLYICPPGDNSVLGLRKGFGAGWSKTSIARSWRDRGSLRANCEAETRPSVIRDETEQRRTYQTTSHHTVTKLRVEDPPRQGILTSLCWPKAEARQRRRAGQQLCLFVLRRRRGCQSKNKVKHTCRGRGSPEKRMEIPTYANGARRCIHAMQTVLAITFSSFPSICYLSENVLA